MNAFVSLLRWEARRLAREGTARATLALLLLAGVLALWAGGRAVARQSAEIAALPAHYETQMRRIAARFPEREHAGYVAYYTFFPAHDPAPPLAPLTTGLRDVAPAAVWVRLLGLEAQLYESALGNPALQAPGAFDLAFVFCTLAPLALLVLAHDMLTRDREQGVLPLALAQGGGLGRLLAARLLVRSGAIAAVCVALWAGGLAWFGITADTAAIAWLGDALLHLACWAAIAALVAASCRSMRASLAAAGTLWVTAVVALPALLNVVLVAALPVPEGLALTVRQRQEVHAGWDRPKEETFAKFFVTHPEWRGTAPVTGRFAWKWYYAMHQAGDSSVAAEAAAYRARLLARAAAAERLAWLAPPVSAQILLARRAGTDLEAHLAFLGRVRAFHARLQAHFFPLVFAETEITPTDYAAFPRFAAPTPAGDAGAFSERLPLLVLTAGLALWAARTLRRVTA